MSAKRTIQALTLLLAVGLFLTATPAAQAIMGSGYPTGNMMGGFSPPSSSGNSDGNYGWMQNPAMWQMGSYGPKNANGTPDWVNNPAMWQMASNGSYMPQWMLDPAQWQATSGGQFGGWMDRNSDGIADMVQSANTWMALTGGHYGGWMDKNSDGTYDGFQYMTLPGGTK